MCLVGVLGVYPVFVAHLLVDSYSNLMDSNAHVKITCMCACIKAFGLY